MSKSSALAAGALLASLACAAVAPARAQSQDEPRKFCGDPTLVAEEPCKPPNWCEGPDGTFPARIDGTCHPEDAVNGPPPVEQQLAARQAVQPPPIPPFRCPDGYTPVLVQGTQPACASDLQPPLPMQ